MNASVRFLLFVLLAVVGVKLSEEAYGIVAHRGERVLARELRARLLDTGSELVALRTRADSLRGRIEGEDRALERDHRHVRQTGRSVRQGLLTREEYGRYDAMVSRYNDRVAARNEELRALQATLEHHALTAERYNGLADSMHAIAVRMNRPYYQVPTPLEAAAERRAAQ
jgi:ABC-type phosphate transport system auxiliary subunit